MDFLQVANWEKWQSYRKDRGAPPWIKVYRNLFSNPEWAQLSDSEKGQLVSLWIVAADKNGKIPFNEKILKKIAQLDSLNLNKFIDLGFLQKDGCQDDAKMTSGGCQDDAPETETETETEINCSEMKNSISEPELPVLNIPLIPKDGEYAVTQEQIDEWTETYPAVDILQELRKMRQWCIANPKRRKTRRGILRFITSWLAKEQDKGGILRRQSQSKNGSFIIPPGTTKAYYYSEITENLGSRWHDSMNALFDENGNAKNLEETIKLFSQRFAIAPPPEK